MFVSKVRRTSLTPPDLPSTHTLISIFLPGGEGSDLPQSLCIEDGVPGAAEISPQATGHRWGEDLKNTDSESESTVSSFSAVGVADTK